VIDRWSSGAGWLAHPDERGGRASHAVKGDDGVWVFDPLDAPGVDDLLTELGNVTGIAVLGSLHSRDAGRLAQRHGVAVHVPEWMDGIAERIDAPIERYKSTLGGSGFRITRVEPFSMWQEAIAYREDDRTLIIPDIIGSATGYTVTGEQLGVVLPCRLIPPRATLGQYEPERILLGHGEGVFENATEALKDCLAGARKRLPQALVKHTVTNLRYHFASKRG
jgi:hypothetical protein